jgi:hypothetical protein
VLLAAVPLALVAGAIGWALVGDEGGVAGNEPVAAKGMPAAIDPGQIERLRAEAEQHERMAREMMAAAARQPNHPDDGGRLNAEVLDEIREQVDSVAYRMILRADGLHATMMDSPEAVELYRRVMRLFPKTYSAEVARERLTALGAPVEET